MVGLHFQLLKRAHLGSVELLGCAPLQFLGLLLFRELGLSFLGVDEVLAVHSEELHENVVLLLQLPRVQLHDSFVAVQSELGLGILGD